MNNYQEIHFLVYSIFSESIYMENIQKQNSWKFEFFCFCFFGLDISKFSEICCSGTPEKPRFCIMYYPLSATSCYKSIPSFPNYPYVWWLRSCNPLTPWWQKHWRWRAHWWITASTFHGDRPRGCWRRGGRRRSLNHCQGHTLVGCNKKKDICDIDESYILLIFDTIIILT